MTEAQEKFFKFLGVDPEAADLKEAFFEKGYLHQDTVKDRKDLIDPLFAKTYGTINTALKQKFRDYIDFEPGDTKGENGNERPPIEVIGIIAERLQPKLVDTDSRLQELQKELEAAKKTGANAADLEKISKERDALKQQLQDTSGLLDEAKKKVETIETEYKQKDFEKRKTEYFEGAFSDLKIIPTTPKVAITGLKATVREKYNIVDEDGKLIVRDKEGQRIKHPEDATRYAELKDLVPIEAKLEGILDENPHSGKPIPKPDEAPPLPTPNKTTREVNYGSFAQKTA